MAHPQFAGGTHIRTLFWIVALVNGLVYLAIFVIYPIAWQRSYLIPEENLAVKKFFV